MRTLTTAELIAWQRLAEAEHAVREARAQVMRVTNLEHARRSRRLRPVAMPPAPDHNGRRSEGSE